MAIGILVLTAVIVAAIGLVSVGRVAHRYEELPSPSLFDEDEAVEFIAERLPFDVSAQLSYDEVRTIMGWQLEYLERKGVAAETEDELLEEQTRGTGPLVADEDESLAYVLGRMTEAELDVSDEHAAAVIEEVMAYLEAIGAVGSVVQGPIDPI